MYKKISSVNALMQSVIQKSNYANSNGQKIKSVSSYLLERAAKEMLDKIEIRKSVQNQVWYENWLKAI